MTRDAESWTVRITSDLELNFLIYVACSFGLFESGTRDMDNWSTERILMDEHEIQNLKVQWNSCWNQSIIKKLDTKTGVLGFPNFKTIEYSELRMVCSRVWKSFIIWWNMPAGGQCAMYYWEDKPDILKYVQEYENQVGRRIKTFHLNIDLIYTGFDKPIEVNDEYIIMPVRSEYLLKPDWWVRRFKERY